MTHANWKTTAVAIMLVMIPAAAFAACAVPSSPGLVICTPGSGASVNYPAEITAALRAANGLSITAINIYVDGLKTLSESHVNAVDDIDFGIKSGTHSLTVKAWDSSGQIYQAKRTFTVVGGDQPTCSPTTPGIMFCSPANGSYQPQSDVKSLVGALGQGSRINKLQVWFDGDSVGTVNTNNFLFDAGANPGTHTESAKAWDAAGHVYTATVTFKIYYDAACDPYDSNLCNPGVFISGPAADTTVGSGFRISAEVKNNPSPITSMKAYLDGVQVASSSGPVLLANASAGTGSHRLTIQAWDSKGSLYKTVEMFDVE